MRQALVVMLVVCAVTVSAVADRVRLKNGRVIEGKVKQSEGVVLIELNYGVVSFPASEVESIERMPTPSEVVEWRLTQIDRSDPDAVLEIAEWAADNDLPKRSEELLQQALKLDPDHARTRKLLGHVKADGKWLTVAEGVELAAGKLAAGEYDVLLGKLLPTLGDAATSPAHKVRLKHVEAQCRLRSKQFDLAAKAYAALAKVARLPKSAQYAAVAEILEAHLDGMYVVTEASRVLHAGPGAAPVEDGPASLAEPVVLESALRDKAKASIKEAQRHMVEARKLEATDAAAAESKYAQAARHLDEANGIVANIARGRQVEISRRRISMLFSANRVQAAIFDDLKDKLGDVPPATYHDHLTRMVRSLNSIRANIEAILAIAGGFRSDLIIEITDATARLQRIHALIDILRKEREELRDATR